MRTTVDRNPLSGELHSSDIAEQEPTMLLQTLAVKVPGMQYFNKL